MEPTLPPAGWYADPAGSSTLRWWTGSVWGELEQIAPPATPSPFMITPDLPASEPLTSSLPLTTLDSSPLIDPLAAPFADSSLPLAAVSIAPQSFSVPRATPLKKEPEIPAGMYPDPENSSKLRYWDGYDWGPALAARTNKSRRRTKEKPAINKSSRTKRAPRSSPSYDDPSQDLFTTKPSTSSGPSPVYDTHPHETPSSFETAPFNIAPFRDYPFGSSARVTPNYTTPVEAYQYYASPHSSRRPLTLLLILVLLAGGGYVYTTQYYHHSPHLTLVERTRNFCHSLEAISLTTNSAPLLAVPAFSSRKSALSSLRQDATKLSSLASALSSIAPYAPSSHLRFLTTAAAAQARTASQVFLAWRSALVPSSTTLAAKSSVYSPRVRMSASVWTSLAASSRTGLTAACGTNFLAHYPPIKYL